MKYILFILIFINISIQIQAKNLEPNTLASIYQSIVTEPVQTKISVFSAQALNATDKNFNVRLLSNIEQTIRYFKSQATKKIDYKNLYAAMEEYVEEHSLFNEPEENSSFQGCRARVHKVKDKVCVSLQSIYVVPYVTEKSKNHLINRYFNAYIVGTDNSKFFSMDVYERQDQASPSLYKQKQWKKDLYSIPKESYRSLYIDKKYFTSKKARLLWFCSNSYSPFGSSNNQLCNLLKINISTFKIDKDLGHLFTSFSIKEHTKDINIQQTKVVQYSKKHTKIFSSNDESSYYATAVGHNNHLFIYSNSVYCSSKPKVKKIYTGNIDNVQAYVCVGEDDSTYFSNYRLLGVKPEDRGSIYEADSFSF